MLKLVAKSSNRKLGKCAATYRTGDTSVYGSCPSTCPLMPPEKVGASGFDYDYYEALLTAVPKEGLAWTYTHFVDEVLPILPPKDSGPEITCINISTDSPNQALEVFRAGAPTVITVNANMNAKVEFFQNIRVVRCPAEYNDKVTCSNCGGGKPLCARKDRDYIIKFTAHGTSAKKIGTPDKGGCYGSSGLVSLQWHKTMTNSSTPSYLDSAMVTLWAGTLPSGTFLRHHVVGDFGTQDNSHRFLTGPGIEVNITV